MKRNCSLIVGIKNRLCHIKQTFPSMITQYTDFHYELVIVNWYSSDGLIDFLKDSVITYRDIMSDNLRCIKLISINDDLSYNPRRVKNLGADESMYDNYCFTDADVYLGMNYLRCLSKYVQPFKSFVATRSQDSYGMMPQRIKPRINYGNCIVHCSDFSMINGWDESINFYGGDDDDFYHRLKISGVREINPSDEYDCHHYSILHGDELRLVEFEDIERRKPSERMEEIYNNKEYVNIHRTKYKNYKFELIYDKQNT